MSNPAAQPGLEPLLDGTQLAARMPQTAAFLRAAAELEAGGYGANLTPDQCKRRATDYVRECVRLAIALRRAVAADDYPQVSALYREARALGVDRPAYAVEAGLELGVHDDEMRAFAARHRAVRRPLSTEGISP